MTAALATPGVYAEAIRLRSTCFRTRDIGHLADLIGRSTCTSFQRLVHGPVVHLAFCKSISVERFIDHPAPYPADILLPARVACTPKSDLLHPLRRLPHRRDRGTRPATVFVLFERLLIIKQRIISLPRCK